MRIPASPLQACCDGYGHYRVELRFDSPSLTVRTGLAERREYMPSPVLRFSDMLLFSSRFPSKSVPVLEVVFVSTSPPSCRDFICTDTPHVTHPFGLPRPA